jgi:hypothetical protein
MRIQVKAAVMVLVLMLLGALVALPAVNAQTGTAVFAGIFYNTANLTGPVINATPILYSNGLRNLVWAASPTDGSGNIIPGMNPDNWSAIFTATVSFTAGFYEFIVDADDGVRVLIDTNVVIDQFGSTGLKNHRAIVNLTGGTYTVVVELNDISGQSVLNLNWVVSTGTPQATGTAAPIAVGNVNSVRGLAVRSGPFLGASMVAVARQAADYPLLARNSQEGLFTWYLIQFDADTQGWVSGRYLTVEGDPNLLPTAAATAFDTVYDPPGRVVGVTRSNMNFRVYPTERAARVAAVPQLEWGATVEILARTVQGGRDFWYQVRYNRADGTSYVGWILAAYVGVSGDPIDTVPII